MTTATKKIEYTNFANDELLVFFGAHITLAEGDPTTVIPLELLQTIHKRFHVAIQSNASLREDIAEREIQIMQTAERLKQLTELREV